MAMKETFRNFKKRILKEFGNLFGEVLNSKRRSRLGIGVQDLDKESTWNYRTCPSASTEFTPEAELLGAKVFRRDQSFELLCRAKLYLALRSVEDFESLLGLDWRRVWNKEKDVVESLLDLFPSVKHSYECMLPLTARLRKHGIDPQSIDWRNSPYYRKALQDSVQGKNSPLDPAQVLKQPSVPTAKDLFLHEYVDIVASEKNGKVSVRLEDICRSHSIWLDPVDAPKELYKWKLRIQKAIAWAYLNDVVPVMVTLTTFHRWHHLKSLLKVLQDSWEAFLTAGRPASRRKSEMGLEGYVRRLEININDGKENRIDDDKEPATNAGWHPHYHAILFVSKSKFKTVSDMEAQMKKDWSSIVAAQFKAEFGEEIPESYMPAFEAHGLHLSRYSKGEHKGELRPVKDTIYLDKIYGYDSMNVYGADSEMTASVIKDSKVPFDLLREISASNIDLWCEYAIATKGVPALQFSRPLIKKINDYFKAHPDKNPAPADLPPSKVVAHLEVAIQRLFYRNFLIPQLRQKAAEGFEALSSWVKDKLGELGVSALCDDPTNLPRPPNSVDDLLAKKIFSS